MWNRFKTFDPWLFLIPSILLVASGVVIYTLTIDSIGPSLIQHQVFFSIIGLILLFLMAFLNYRSLKAWSPWIYILGFIGLLAVEFIGKADFGAKRWVDLGFFQLQPGEIEKLIIIITLAAFFSKARPAITWPKFLLALFILALPAALVLLQPDFGTSLVIMVVGVGMFFHARLSRAQKITLILMLLSMVTIFTLSLKEVKPFNKILKEYQKDRLISFIDPARDKGGSGYHVLQSVITVGSGGIMGKGLGNGSQSQLNFLPVSQTDFIFAGLAEAWGFVGAISLFLLYGFLLFRIMQAAKIAKDEFGMLICIGVIIKITFEILVNIGMNIHLMPVTGIPLPFLSAGGTTLFTNALCIGLVQSIVMRYKRLTFSE